MHIGTHLPTNLAIDDKLIEEARRIGGHGTKKDAVNAALDEYIRRRKQLKILRLFGAIEYAPGYDYKANRRRDLAPQQIQKRDLLGTPKCISHRR